MARRPPPLPDPSPSRTVEEPEPLERNAFPELDLPTDHDAATCPTCAPLIHSPAAVRGIARARHEALGAP